MDPLAEASLFGVGGTFLMTVGAIAAAVINSKTERKGSAENALEKTLRERLTLKDEIITDLRSDIEELERDVADRDEVIEKRDEAIAARDTLIEEYRRAKGREVRDGRA